MELFGVEVESPKVIQLSHGFVQSTVNCQVVLEHLHGMAASGERPVADFCYLFPNPCFQIEAPKVVQSLIVLPVAPKDEHETLRLIFSFFFICVEDCRVASSWLWDVLDATISSLSFLLLPHIGVYVVNEDFIGAGSCTETTEDYQAFVEANG